LVLLVRLEHDPGFEVRRAETVQVSHEGHAWPIPSFTSVPIASRAASKMGMEDPLSRASRDTDFGARPWPPCDATPWHAHTMLGLAGGMAVAVAVVAAAVAVSRSSIGDICCGTQTQPGMGDGRWDGMGWDGNLRRV
jgi:hypothetical protein